jgi:cysteine synthase B
MVDVSVLSPNPKVRVYTKLEGQNPGGSVKDRIALSMIEAAERDGRLTPGATLIEPSSGNTGIGLALVSLLKGYRIKIVMPANVTTERRQMLLAFGAEIIESPGSEGSNGAVRLAEKLAGEHPEWVFLYQYGNPDNPGAHERTTGPEILRDCPDITHFVAGLGTAGTLMGVGRYLKREKPGVQVWAVEPPSGEMVDGLRNLDDGYIPPVFTDNDGFNLLDRKKVVSPLESVAMTQRMVRETGLFVGISSGAIMSAALKCAAEIDEGVIVTIVCDGGWKYLSTGVFTDDVDVVAERATKVIYF